MKKVSNFILDLIENGQITWDPSQFEDRNFLEAYFGETPGKPAGGFKDESDMKEWVLEWIRAHGFQVIKRSGNVVFTMDQKYWTYKDPGSREVMIDLYAYDFLPDAYEVRPKKVVQETVVYEPIPKDLRIKYIRNDGSEISKGGVSAFLKSGWYGVGIDCRGTRFIITGKQYSGNLETPGSERYYSPHTTLRERFAESGYTETQHLTLDPSIVLESGEFIPGIPEMMILEENLGIINEALGDIGLPVLDINPAEYTSFWTSGKAKDTEAYVYSITQGDSRLYRANTSGSGLPSSMLPIILVLKVWPKKD
jgi:hypothetical protein